MGNLKVVILAAGKGTRMYSDTPKVLHLLAGKSLLEHVITVANSLRPQSINVVYGNLSEKGRKKFSYLPVEWVLQREQKGTAHALRQVLPKIKAHDFVLVIYGDVPLISKSTLISLIRKTPKKAIGWLTAILDNPIGFGRIVRNEQKKPIAIIEEKDATNEQKAIREINTGICLFPGFYLKKWLPKIRNNNAQKEYYLTDLFARAVTEKIPIITKEPMSKYEVLGINNCAELAHLERVFQRAQAQKFMKKGLTLCDPDRFDIRGNLRFGRDVIIDANVVIEGDVSIGSGSIVGPFVHLKNAIIGRNVIIHSHSVIEDATIDDACTIGPFARLRPEVRLKRMVRVGNFVEIKKSVIDIGSKVNHLSYIGDAAIGKAVNIGAGTITCNYDGVNKHRTLIQDEAFIGSNTALVAPVVVGKKATIGAGSVITNDAPSDKLTLARGRQVTINRWKRPTKKEKHV